MSPTPAPGATTHEQLPRKAALASFVGSMLEYYDFFIYGAAAGLVFPQVFFPESDPSTATLLSLATFGVAYVARPLGAVVIGHFGDRVGRKRMLVLTLLLMGVSTFLIGALPSYAAIGVAAPALLVLLRVLQGLSAAGEQSGANSLTLEHAPEGRRGFFTSFTLSGTQAGLILANVVFLLVALLPEDQLLSWGWRVPFFLSAVVVAVGYWVRRSLPETAEFERVEQEHTVAKLPVAVLFRDHWAAVLRVVFCALVSVVSTIVSTWALAHGTNIVGMERSTLLWMVILANVVALGVLPLWARLSDRIGRRPVFALGALGSAALAFPFLWALQQGNGPLVVVLGIALFGVVYSAANGIWPSFYGEMFSTQVRYSGMAIGTQIGFALGGFSPVIATAIAGEGSGGWVPVALLTAGAAAVAGLCALTARETAHVPLEQLGDVHARAGVREKSLTRA
ncbi:sugar phosphate permease [Geodermatophilus tzadiensis]|uniref:Putative proline/betaine transporter n=1 Tax=Geodermatophilus tzadiensis TaxID=1137988 RepID=A0A2T0TSG2_9ACTN|nr:MFS transporter [Geodermatophilus tzadiensis]PRY48468.1 sugar phosphate permease [Geodermatophilus tzadiensis]